MNIAEKLSQLVKFRTVSSFDPEEEDDGPFAALIAALPELFPLAHARLERICIGSRGIVYRWQGTDPSLKPAIFCAHFDVVPASETDAWDEPPFSGAIRNGYVWGRGTQDIKVQLACILESAEQLAANGFQPQRTLYFAFGGDEEVGGTRGAGAIAKWFSEQHIHASWVIDEGSPVGQGLVGFVRKPLALIGIAEKGYADIIIEAQGQGGHASMPPRHTALGAVAHALAAIEDNPFPARLTKTTDGFLAALAPHAIAPYKQIFRASAHSFALYPEGVLRHAFHKCHGQNNLCRNDGAGKPERKCASDVSAGCSQCAYDSRDELGGSSRALQSAGLAFRRKSIHQIPGTYGGSIGGIFNFFGRLDCDCKGSFRSISRGCSGAIFVYREHGYQALSRPDR